MKLLCDAAGHKWSKDGEFGTTSYASGIEYHDGKLEAIYAPDGRMVAEYAGGQITRYRAEYFHQDHLGNTRLVFSDFNQDGIVGLGEDDPATPLNELEITQESHYYPFGMNHLGPWYETVAPENKYLYNGIERNEDLGLNWDLAEFRSYDATIGRWNQVDPLADWAPDWTPYRFGFNNPNSYLDPFGLFESRREARRYRRKQDDDDIRHGKIKKNDDGTFSIRYGDSGSITRNEEGQIEYAAVAGASYTGPAIRAYEPNFFENVQNSGFVGSFIYGLANDAWLTTQRFNPFDTHTTHLAGHYASKDEYTMGFVNTVATAVPVGRATTTVKAVTPTGVTLMQRLNAAQFSKRFKGTILARTHPRIRGRLNRLLNKGVDQVNTRVQTGNVLFQGTKMAGNAANKEE